MNFKIEDFFDRSYELQINENMFYYSYKFPHNEVCEYLESIINTPYSEFVTYIQNHIQCDYITSKDIPQFSSFKNCTKNICKKLLEVNDPGLQFIEIGKLLLDDGNSRNDVAYRKYGENHSKTAFELGMNITMTACPGTAGAPVQRQCLFAAWGDTALSVSGTTADISQCMSATGVYVSNSQCLMMEAY